MKYLRRESCCAPAVSLLRAIPHLPPAARSAAAFYVLPAYGTALPPVAAGKEGRRPSAARCGAPATAAAVHCSAALPAVRCRQKEEEMRRADAALPREEEEGGRHCACRCRCRTALYYVCLPSLHIRASMLCASASISTWDLFLGALWHAFRRPVQHI